MNSAAKSASSTATNTKKKSASLGLLRRNIAETDSENEDSDTSDVADPWSTEFDRYINTAEAVEKDIDIVDWWGVRALFLRNNNSIDH